MIRFAHTESRSLLSIGGAGLLFCCATVLSAQQIPGVTDSDSHSWARFGPRAWKVVRVKTESYNDKGEVERSSTRTTRMQVTAVSLHSFSLCVSSTVELSGNELVTEPQTVKQSLDQNIVSTANLKSQTLSIGNREYIAKVVRIVSQNEGITRTSTVYYSTHASPEVLKRRTVSTNTKTGDVVSETDVTVTEVDRQHEILGEMLNTWTVSIVFKQGESTTMTTEVHCIDVPGELVSRESVKRDGENRRLVAKTQLELVGYGYGRLRRAWRRRR